MLKLSPNTVTIKNNPIFLFGMEREIEIRAIECVFCGHKEHFKVKNELVDRETGAFAGRGMDEWICPCCGETVELGLEYFRDGQKVFMQYAEKDDWDGLLRFCQSEDFDDLALIFLAKAYLQKKDFEKAGKIAEVLLKIDPSDWEARQLIEGIQRKGSKLRIKAGFSEIEAAFCFSDRDNYYVLDLETGEIRFTQDSCPDEGLGREVDANPGRFIKIPKKDPHESYHLMESFIHEIGEHQGLTNIAGELEQAISQKKPFAGFKSALLGHPGIREQWFAFEQGVTRERVCGWLCEHNLICRFDKGQEAGKDENRP